MIAVAAGEPDRLGHSCWLAFSPILTAKQGYPPIHADVPSLRPTIPLTTRLKKLGRLDAALDATKSSAPKIVNKVPASAPHGRIADLMIFHPRHVSASGPRCRICREIPRRDI